MGSPKRQNVGVRPMNKSLRSSSAASIVVLASILAGCAAPQASSGESLGMGGRAGDVGLATRAQIALNSNKVPQAIQLAEQAVAKSPTDAGFRALLGNAYFAGGRFQSAESPFRRSRLQGLVGPLREPAASHAQARARADRARQEE